MDSRPVPRLVISGPMKLEMPNMSRQVLAPANIRYGTMPLKPFRPKPSSVIKNGIISTPNIWNRPTIAEFSAEVLNPWSTRYAPPVIVVRPAPPHEQGVASPKRATAMATSGSNPSPTKKGAAIAAGEPAPAAPSKNIGTIMPTMTSCALLSRVTLASVF